MKLRVFHSDDFYKAWRYLEEHPYFQFDGMEYFPANLTIEVVKVEPISKKIVDDASKNTLTQIWIEAGPPFWCTEFEPHQVVCGLDHELDTGGTTFEQAIINMANLLAKKETSLMKQRSKKYGKSKFPKNRKKKGD